ncbi:penicillin-binding transpeptidase domain-containing protein, partial [Akkermansiaceae bacterium]|nr:penicillin-binding transpeptidase domain-containing protein [Akkermansiaceae bacterium]
SGMIANRSNLRTFASATYGYGVSASPLQVAMAYAAIANDGVLMKPRLIQSVITNNGVEIESREPVQVRQAVSQRAAQGMRGALETVVGDGTRGPTGWRAFVPGYRIGGKTGTAWRYIDGEGYDTSTFVVSFAGIVPVENPRFVAYVVIDHAKFDDPDASIGGGSVAAPVFKRVAERVIKLLDIEPTEPIEIRASDVALSNE